MLDSTHQWCSPSARRPRTASNLQSSEWPARNSADTVAVTCGPDSKNSQLRVTLPTSWCLRTRMHKSLRSRCICPSAAAKAATCSSGGSVTRAGLAPDFAGGVDDEFKFALLIVPAEEVALLDRGEAALRAQRKVFNRDEPGCF